MQAKKGRNSLLRSPKIRLNSAIKKILCGGTRPSFLLQQSTDKPFLNSVSGAVLGAVTAGIGAHPLLQLSAFVSHQRK